MTVDLVLTDAKAYVKERLVDCSIALDGGRIFRIAKDANMPSADNRIELKKMLILPGLIDSHVHLRDQGKAYKEDFYSGTAAAAAGGMTTVLDMPNNDPVTMNAAALRRRMEIARNKILVNVGFFSEFPESTEEINEIAKEGPIGFKLFLCTQVGGLNIDDDKNLLEAFVSVSRTGFPVLVHAEDRRRLEKAREELVRAEQNDIEAFLRAHEDKVEEASVKRSLNIAEKADVQMHLCHISTEGGLNASVEGKKSGMKVSCEVTPHHLFLSQSHLKRIGSRALTMPPVRNEQQSAALWRGIEHGWIDLLASDHAPHTTEEKEADSIWNVKTGIPGLETTLPLMLTQVHRGRLTITEIVKLLAERPSEIFGLQSKGYLKEGNDADIVVVDLNRKHKVDASVFHSKAKYSPFDGWKLHGKPVKTFVNGQLVMDEGEIIKEAGNGKITRRK